jgi:cob(I)alamin adenosyltransferase
LKIYTRSGDEGNTSLVGGARVSKADPRVHAYGEVDELNAWLGLIRSTRLDDDLDAVLAEIQSDLFALGAQLADPTGRTTSRVAKASLGDADVLRLERHVDRLDAELPALATFILPGGAQAGAMLHLARTVCRRAERHMVDLRPPLGPVLLKYVNRLSDLLFVMARAANRRQGRDEQAW